jgi:hypothetical protein
VVGEFLNPDDLSGWVQAPEQVVEQTVADVEAKARRVATCLFDPLWPGDRNLVVSILRPAAIWLASTRGGVVSQHVTGPFSEMFRDRASGLSDSDIADLRALCGTPQAPSGVPLGRFPPARDYGRLFHLPPPIGGC